MKRYNVPKAKAKKAVATETLQVRGIKTKHIKFLKDQAHELGYSTYGEYLNALLDVVRKDIEAGDAVRKKGR